MNEDRYSILPFLKDKTEISQLFASVDWSKTPLGDVEVWPVSLRVALGVFMYSPLPKLLCWGRELTCIYNDAFRNFLSEIGNSPDAIGNPLDKVLPGDCNQLIPAIKMILDKKVVSRNIGIENIQNQNPGIREYGFLCNAIYESDGNVSGVLLTARVASEKRDQHHPTSEISSQISEILKLAPVGLAHISVHNYSIVFINDVLLELTGRKLNEVKDRPLFSVFPFQFERLMPIFQSVLSSGNAFYGNEVPVKIIKKDRPELLYLNLVIYPVRNSQGDIDSIMMTVLDETDNVNRRNIFKEREIRFSGIIQNSRMGFAILKGEHFIIEYGNTYLFENIWMMDPEQVLGKSLLEVFPAMVNQRNYLQLKTVYETGKTIFEKRSPTHISTGQGIRKFYLDFEFAPLFDDEDKVMGITVSAYDVTETVLLELQRKEAQARLELSLDATGLALWEVDLRNRRLSYSERLSTILMNIENSEDLNVFKDNIIQEDWPVAEQAFTTAMKNGVYQYEARVRNAAGEIVWIRVRGRMFFDRDGEPLRIIGTTRDITIEKRNQRDLIRRESRLRRLVLQAPVAIGILRGPDYKVEIINEKALRLLGRTEENLLDKPILEVMNEVDVEAAKQMLDVVFYKGETVSAKEYGVRLMRGGKMIKIYVNFEYDPLRNEKGEVIGVIVVGTEVTDQVMTRKRIEASELQFRLLADSIPHFVWLESREGNFEFVNQTMQTYTGRDAGRLTSEGFLSIVHPEDKQRVQEKWQHAIDTVTEFVDELRILNVDGSYRWFMTRSIPMKKADKVGFWIVTCTDIQEIKEQDQQKDYFISRASHELKTPITSLKGYVQILMNLYHDTRDQVLKNSLNRMDFQVDKLTRLIVDLLDTTRLDTNGLVMEKQLCNVPSLIRNVIEELHPAYPNYSIQFSSTDEIEINIDRERISQVIINLLTNAIKYSPVNKVVEVDARKEGDYLAVSVTDYGIGINKAHFEKIFERFYRVTGDNKETFPGFGIGLFLVNEIVKKHNGSVSIKSEEGRGSTFTVFLPMNSN